MSKLRIRAMPALATALLATSCAQTDDPPPFDVNTSLYALVTTIDGVFFAPPFGPTITPTGPFDGTLLNRAALIIESISTQNDVRTVAIFDARSSPPLRVVSDFQMYGVNVLARNYLTDSALAYRFIIQLDGRELGRSDIDPRIFIFMSQNPNFMMGAGFRLEARPVPSIASITPSSLPRNAEGFTLTVSGASFVRDSIIRVAGTDYATQWIDANTMRTDIPASMLTVPGTLNITAFTPAPGGGSSAASAFTIFDPPPVITSVSPDQATANSPATVITVRGESFTDSSSVRVQGTAIATQYVSPSELSATIPAGQLELAGTRDISVVNFPNLHSGTVPFTIVNPAPVLSSIDPNTVVAGGLGFTLTVTGLAFTRQSQIFFDGAALNTSYSSPTRLSATIASTRISDPALHTITVESPAPGGGRSGEVVLTVANPIPTFTGMSPSAVVAGSAAVTLAIDGSSFLNGAVVTWNEAGLATTYVSNARLTAEVPAELLIDAGTAQVAVRNPEPFPETTVARAFSIQSPAPAVTAFAPTGATIGQPNLFLSITGTNFLAGVNVTFDGQAATSVTRQSSTQLSATFPGSVMTRGGNIPVVVSNPAPSAGNATYTIFVNYPIPTVTSLSRYSAPVGSPDFVLEFTGSNFYNLPYLSMGPRELAFRTWISPTRTIVTVPANYLNTPGTFDISMRNPLPTPGWAPAIPFTVLEATCSDAVRNGDEEQVDCGGSACLPCVLQNCTPGDPSCTELSVGLTTMGGLASASDTAGGLTPASINDSTSSSGVPGWGNNSQAGSRLMVRLARPYEVFRLGVFWGGSNGGWNNGTNANLPTQLQVQYSNDPAASASDPAGSPLWTSLSYTANLLASTSGVVNDAHVEPQFTDLSWNALHTISFNRVEATAIRLVFDGSPASNGGSNRVGLIAELDVVAAVAPDGSACSANAACASGVCAAGICEAPSCTDGVHNGVETDVDCGGLCAECAVGARCYVAADCAEHVCTDQICQAPTCSDGQSNGSETGADCGGSCSPCPDGSPCSSGSDCTSLVCNASGTCAAASCFDGLRNGTESDVDCGSHCALRCDDGLRCGVNLDCASERCAGGICQVPAAILSSLSPSSVMVGAGTFTLTLNGVFFRPISEVSFNGSPLAISFISTEQLTVEVPAALLADAGVFEVNISNPGSNATATRSFSVNNPAPILTSFTPSAVLAGSGGFTMTIDGSSFIDGASVSLNGATLATTFVSDTQLTAAVPASSVANGGYYNLFVANPSPSVSASVTRTFTVNNPIPAISALTPPSAPVGRGDLSLQIDGTGFQSGATVRFDGTIVGAVRNSSSRMTATIPAALLSVAGTVAVTVTNGAPSGGDSDPAAFSVDAPSCSDGVRNGAETDLDCGGGCPGCATGRFCSLAADCASLVCTTGICQAPLCTDGITNGSESDIDCGGSCADCADGRACTAGGDCASGVCEAGFCVTPTCDDGVQNGGEAGVDCGGTCPNGCVISACGSGSGACTSCLAILEAGLSQGDGLYTIDPDGAGANAPFATFCDMTTDGGGWSLAAKLSAAAMGAGATDPRVAMYAGNLNVGNVGLMNRGNQTLHYSTPLVTSAWSSFTEARYEVIDNGAVAQFLVFDSTGVATPQAAFSRSRLKYTSWNDMFEGTYNYFSVDGDTGTQRHFFINNSYNGCPSDVGWMVVTHRSAGGACAWETGRMYNILYSRVSTNTLNAGASYVAASALALWVRERPPETAQTSCLEILESGASTGTGVYNIVRNGVTVPVFCDMDTAGGGWTMVYKHSAGAPIPASNTDFITVNYLSGSTNEMNTALLDRGRDTVDYSNRFLSREWGRFREARVEVWNAGAAVHYMRYNAALGSGPVGAIARGNLVESSWGDLLAESQNFWSARGDEGNRRHWLVNRNYGGCGSDAGWLAVINGSACSWETSRPSSILYANAGGYQNYTSGSVATADALALMVRERVPVAAGLAPRTCQAWLTAGFTTSGEYTIDPLQSGTSIPVYCDMTTDGGGWTFAWKHSSGINRDLGADIAGANLNAGNMALMTRNRDTIDFASPVLAGYRFPQFTQARFEVVAGGTVRRYFVHNAVGQTARTVMARGTLLRTDWTDITSSTQNFFSIDGDSSCRRRAFINRSYGGCSVDSGWLVALQGTGCNCGWETANPDQIMYAVPATSQNWTSGSVARADALIMWLR